MDSQPMIQSQTACQLSMRKHLQTGQTYVTENYWQWIFPILSQVLQIVAKFQNL